MQTFLPHKSFKKSLKVLDWRRLGKQRVEAHQVLNVLLGRTETKGWRNHPITRMWDGYEPALTELIFFVKIMSIIHSLVGMRILRIHMLGLIQKRNNGIYNM